MVREQTWWGRGGKKTEDKMRHLLFRHGRRSQSYKTKHYQICFFFLTQHRCLLPSMHFWLWLGCRIATIKKKALTHLCVVWRWWGLSFEFLMYETTIKKHLVDVVYFPFTHNQGSLKLIFFSSFFSPHFSLDSLKQLPCVSIEVWLRGNDKSKMSKSLVMWEEQFPGMSRYIAEC